MGEPSAAPENPRTLDQARAAASNDTPAGLDMENEKDEIANALVRDITSMLTIFPTQEEKDAFLIKIGAKPGQQGNVAELAKKLLADKVKALEAGGLTQDELKGAIGTLETEITTNLPPQPAAGPERVPVTASSSDAPKLREIQVPKGKEIDVGFDNLGKVLEGKETNVLIDDSLKTSLEAALITDLSEIRTALAKYVKDNKLETDENNPLKRWDAFHQANGARIRDNITTQKGVWEVNNMIMKYTNGEFKDYISDAKKSDIAKLTGSEKLANKIENFAERMFANIPGGKTFLGGMLVNLLIWAKKNLKFLVGNALDPVINKYWVKEYKEKIANDLLNGCRINKNDKEAWSDSELIKLKNDVPEDKDFMEIMSQRLKRPEFVVLQQLAGFGVDIWPRDLLTSNLDALKGKTAAQIQAAMAISPEQTSRKKFESVIGVWKIQVDAQKAAEAANVANELKSETIISLLTIHKALAGSLSADCKVTVGGKERTVKTAENSTFLAEAKGKIREILKVSDFTIDKGVIKDVVTVDGNTNSKVPHNISISLESGTAAGKLRITIGQDVTNPKDLLPEELETLLKYMDQLKFEKKTGDVKKEIADLMPKVPETGVVKELVDAYKKVVDGEIQAQEKAKGEFFKKTFEEALKGSGIAIEGELAAKDEIYTFKCKKDKNVINCVVDQSKANAKTIKFGDGQAQSFTDPADMTTKIKAAFPAPASAITK